MTDHADHTAYGVGLLGAAAGIQALVLTWPWAQGGADTTDNALWAGALLVLLLLVAAAGFVWSGYRDVLAELRAAKRHASACEALFRGAASTLYRERLEREDHR